nr:DNA gyrase inhibitor YacG [Roseospira visakhapatnamensis]
MAGPTGDPQADAPSAEGLGGARCPVCERPTTARYRPFCSRRCADVDLGHWLTERYVVPGNPALEQD